MPITFILLPPQRSSSYWAEGVLKSLSPRPPPWPWRRRFGEPVSLSWWMEALVRLSCYVCVYMCVCVHPCVHAFIWLLPTHTTWYLASAVLNISFLYTRWLIKLSLSATVAIIVVCHSSRLNNSQGELHSWPIYLWHRWPLPVWVKRRPTCIHHQ